MLAAALLQRETGVPSSERLGIKDEVVALSFDLAVTLRLLTFDNECRKTEAKLIAYEMSKMFGNVGDDVLEHEFLAGDRYADGNTQIW